MSFFVLSPEPFSPVQRALKFSAVFGTVSAKSSMTTRPVFLADSTMASRSRAITSPTTRAPRIRVPVTTIAFSSSSSYSSKTSNIPKPFSPIRGKVHACDNARQCCSFGPSGKRRGINAT